MVETAGPKTSSNAVELATFYTGNALCGMDIINIQEINKIMEMTKVPRSPEYVTGIMNLRGQIVTVIDLGKKLGLSSTGMKDTTRNIIVNSKGEHIGLLVEQISDVVQANWASMERPPASIGEVQGKYFKGVFKTENSLIGVLDVAEVLRESD